MSLPSTIVRGGMAAGLVLVLASCDRSSEALAGTRSGVVDRAVCVLRPVGDGEVEGSVTFTREGEALVVRGQVRGLAPGKHGFHIHEFGDLSDLDTGKSAGGHFAPEGNPHGRPGDEKRHAGDLGNIEADAEGVAEIEIRDTRLSLDGVDSILGRAIVVHAGEDKFTQPSGDAGGRVAVGVIGRAK